MVANTPMQPSPGAARVRQHAVPDISDRLSRGENAQDLLDEVMGFIVLEPIVSQQLAADCIILLADHGARVATDQPGCALENLIYQPAQPRPGLVRDVIDRLAGKPGELPFHVLAKHFTARLSVSQISNPDIQASLRSRDSMGRTVSHWLWAADGIMAKEASERTVDDTHSNMWSTRVRRAWIVQSQLQDLGVSLDLPDNNGRTAVDLCIERIEAGDAIVMPAYHASRYVQACQSRRRMQGRTMLPLGLPPSSPGMRF